MNRSTKNINDQGQSGRGTLSLGISKNTIWTFFSLVLFKLVLDLSYYFVLAQLFSYTRLELHPNTLKLVESYVFLVLVFVLMPKSAKKLSYVLLWLLILLSYVPMLTLFALGDEARTYMYAVTGFWVLALLLLRIPMPAIALASLRQAAVIRYCLFICLTTLVFYMVYKYLGLSLKFGLERVYDIRSQFIAVEIPFSGYLFNWVAFILNPVFFALFIKDRKWLLLAPVVILQLLLFSVTGFRSYLFVLPWVLALIWIITRRHPFCFMAIGLAGVVLVGIFSYCWLNNTLISALFSSRVLLTPAQLSFFYYDFFSQHDFVFLSQSIFRFFLDYPYQVPVPYIIAGAYYDSPQMWACTGITGNAYMNFGFVGLALGSILLVIILKLMDTCSKNVDLRVGIAAVAMPAFTLTSGGLLTNLLTYGLLLALLLLYLLPKREKLLQVALC